MKKLITILLTIVGMWAQAQDRPPIQTNELRTNELEWRTLPMGRDSLPYWFPINANSFSLSRPDGSNYQTYSFASDSVYWGGGDIYVCEGCTINYNDSVFLVRRDPACSNCWQYSYNNGVWRDLFCEPLMNRVFEIIPSSKTVLKEGDYLDWLDETNLRAGVTYMGFKRNAANAGKFLTYDNDSVRWGDPFDSIYYNGHWYTLPDTIPVLHDVITINNVSLTDGDSIEVDPSVTNEKDSIRINGVWYGNGDTYTPIDNSITNEKDSFYVVNLERWISGGEFVDLFWKYNPDSLSPYSGKGIWYDEEAVGIGTEPSDYWAKLRVQTNKASSSGIECFSENFWGLTASSVGTDDYGDGGGVSGGSGSGIGIRGRSLYNYAGQFEGYLGLISNKISVGYEGDVEYSLPENDGDSLSVLSTNGHGAVGFRQLGTISAFNIWTGTQAEYDALTPDANTLYFIHNGYGWLGVFMLLLLCLGSNAQNWTAVKVGATDVNRIYQGGDVIWEKPSECIDTFTTVTIGTQTWTKYNLHITDGNSGIYSYDNNVSNSNIYGYLYNYDAALRIDSFICGWHLPTSAELAELSTYLGGDEFSGGKLKETGFAHWFEPNEGATNETWFTAIGSGYYAVGDFFAINEICYLWSSTYDDIRDEYIYYRLSFNDATFTNPGAGESTDGCSIRLIKD